MLDGDSTYSNDQWKLKSKNSEMFADKAPQAVAKIWDIWKSTL